MKTYKWREITEKIIGAAYKVHNTPGSGFLFEKVYQNSLVIALQTLGFSVEVEKPITVYYHDKVVGNYVADSIVDKNESVQSV